MTALLKLNRTADSIVRSCGAVALLKVQRMETGYKCIKRRAKRTGLWGRLRAFLTYVKTNSGCPRQPFYQFATVQIGPTTFLSLSIVLWRELSNWSIQMYGFSLVCLSSVLILSFFFMLLQLPWFYCSFSNIGMTSVKWCRFLWHGCVHVFIVRYWPVTRRGNG